MRTLMLLLIIGSLLVTAGQSVGAAQSKSVKSFTFSISSDPVVALGSPVEVRVRLTNMSTLDINGSTANIKGFGLAYAYDVRDQSGNKMEPKQVDPTHQASVQVFVLKPGESRGDLTRLNEAYEFSPGKYTIQLSMAVSSDPRAGIVKSNKILITVTP